MEKKGKTSKCGQGSREKSYDDKIRFDATGDAPRHECPKARYVPSGKYDDADEEENGVSLSLQ